MTLTNFAEWSESFLRLLADSALRTLILAAVAGLGLALLRVKSTSLRLLTWTGVLYAAVVLPFVSGLLPVLPVPVPSLLRSAVTLNSEVAPAFPQVSRSNSKMPAEHPRARNSSREQSTFAAGTTEFSSARLPSDIHGSKRDFLRRLSHERVTLATGVYFTVALLMMTRLCVGLLLARRLVAHSREIREPRLVRIVAQTRRRIQRLQILESSLVTVPITVGTISPAIVLPANWKAWDQSKLDAVLAHELSHVTRHDALTQLVARVYRAAFWFSPLSWWLAREIHTLAEQASDEAALSAGVDRGEYAKALLGFFETVQCSPRVWWQGVSMASAGRAEHRLERILSWRGVHMNTRKSVLVALAALAVPAFYVVAAARPASHEVRFAQASDGTQSLPAPAQLGGAPGIPAAPAIAPAAPRAPVHGVVAAGPAAPALPGVPAVPGVPAAPAIAWSGQSHGTGSSHNRSFYAYGFDDEQAFVIVSGNSDSLTMSGTSEDAHHVQRLKKQIPGDFIWFRRDEKPYIIRDQATVDRARKLWAPQDELGKKQEELGKQQEALGKQQEELGAKMEQVRVNVPDMTAQLDALKAKLQKLGPTATIDQIGELQSEIGDLQSKMGEIQSQAGEQQSKFGEEQGALGEKQGKLGEEQGKIGNEQAELAEKATKQMKALFDEAIKNGTAKPEPGSNDGGSI